MTRQIISANRLTDGIVVYLTEAGDWTERIDAALIVNDETAVSAAATAAAAVARQHVVDPYPVEIDDAGGRPTRFREFIRAQGPTVRRDLGKQAVNG